MKPNGNMTLYSKKKRSKLSGASMYVCMYVYVSVSVFGFFVSQVQVLHIKYKKKNINIKNQYAMNI